MPEGILRSKHPLQNWDTSPDLLISTLQILLYNLLSIIAIIFGNIFSTRKDKTHCFMPLGYLAFFSIISFDAIVLGTWSFSVVTNAIPLMDRFIGTFDLLHRAGLWEISGQLFILCATAKISLVITDGKETTKRNWKIIRLSKQEIIIFGIGLIFMLLGAIVESYAIINIK